MSQKEKRRYSRVTPEQGRPIVVDINGSNFVDVFKAVDISEGGLGISVPHGFEGCAINEPVQLVIKLPDPVAGSFTATGKIRHISQSNFGVTFLALREDSRKLTRKYVSYREHNGTWLTRLRKRWQ